MCFAFSQKTIRYLIDKVRFFVPFHHDEESVDFHQFNFIPGFIDGFSLCGENGGNGFQESV
jgi:uncharacterized membrane protein